MNNKNNKSQLITLTSIMISFLIMMFISKITGLILLTLIIGFNIYKQSYLLKVIKGNKAYAIKDFDTALKNYKKAISSKFVNAGVIRGYILIELKHGNANIANKVLTDILNERTFTSHDLLVLNVSKALILWKLGNITDAIDILKELLKTEKSNYIYETLTTLLLINGNINESLSLIKEGLDYDENNTILKSNFAEANYKLGNISASEEYFSNLLEENVEFIEPYYFSSLILKEKGEIQKAIELLERGLEKNDSLLTTVSKDDAKKLLDKLTQKK